MSFYSFTCKNASFTCDGDILMRKMMSEGATMRRCHMWTAPQLPTKHFCFRFGYNPCLFWAQKYLMIKTLLLLVFYFIVSQTKPSRKILFSKSPSAFLRLDDSDSGDKFQACSCRLQAVGVAELRPLCSSALFEDNIIIRSVAFATAGCSSLIGPS